MANALLPNNNKRSKFPNENKYRRQRGQTIMAKSYVH